MCCTKSKAGKTTANKTNLPVTQKESVGTTVNNIINTSSGSNTPIKSVLKGGKGKIVIKKI